MVANTKHKKHLTPSLYKILQVVSVASLEHIPLEDLFMKYDARSCDLDVTKKLEINC
jgi:hypothetical protein